MQARRILSMVLALALMVGVIAPCSSVVHAAEEKFYDQAQNLEQVTAPVVGESYYLAADVEGELLTFTTGGVSETDPYSLKTIDISNKYAKQVTLVEETVADTGDFRISFDYDGKTAYIYCRDENSDGKPDTGTRTEGVTASRCSFYTEEINGVTLIREHGDDYVLTVKELTHTDDTTVSWRMQCVPLEELAEDGAYPVMLLQEHAHDFAGDKYESDETGHRTVCWCGTTAAQTQKHDFSAPVINGNTVSRSCTVCGYAETVYDQEYAAVNEPVLGQPYYLAANVDGKLYSYVIGGYTQTLPYSLKTGTTMAQATLEKALEAGKGEFQIVVDGGRYIYCFDYVTSEGNKDIMDTGATLSEDYFTPGRISFSLDQVDGVTVFRKYLNNNVLVAKKLTHTDNTTESLRMLGVPEAELADDNVYPVMLLQAHEHDFESGKPQGSAAGHTEACWCGAVGENTKAHTFGAPTTTGNTASRTCTACDYVQTVYDQKYVAVDEPVLGKPYYLAANVDGELRTFTTGGVGDTTPYSLKTIAISNQYTKQVTLNAAVETGKGEFQITFDNDGSVVYIYCYDAKGSDGVLDTGTTGTASNFTPVKTSFSMSESGGVPVLRKYSAKSDNVLVVKYFASTETYRMLGVPETDLTDNTEVEYPVMLLEEHTHEAGSEITKSTDTGHAYGCWCGGAGEEVAHTYGKSVHDTTTKTTTRTCTACGYVAAVHGHSQAQVKYPEIGQTYNLVVNKDGELLSFTTGGVTETTPYSLKTTATLNTVTVNAALKDGQGDFQLVASTGHYIYSIDKGVGLTTSTSYTTYPEKVSFSMDWVEGVPVLRAYGTQKILAAQYSEAKSAWRIFPVDDSAIGTAGVYPVMLTVDHTEHTYDDTWHFDEEAGTQSKLCTACGAIGETLYGTDIKVSQVTEAVVGNSYHLAANIGGTLQFFRHGTATDTDPYSLVVTDNFAHNWVVKVTLEDYTAATSATEGFQLTYTNPSTDVLTRIYCYDAKNSDSVMDTGINTADNTKNKHNFNLDVVDGVTVLRKASNNNVLVVKYNETAGAWRMLGVPDTELGSEGVYPAMLVNVHEHSFGDELSGDSTGHYYSCDCGTKQVTSHSFGQWTLDRAGQKQSATCAVCNYTLTVASPYFDTVESKEELENGLADTVQEDGVYTVSGGKDYYLVAEKDGVKYYFRNADMTATGHKENITSTAGGYSLYTTDDPNHAKILKTKVTEGNTEDTYVIYTRNDNHRAVYVRDEGSDSVVDTGLTVFNGVSTNATYKARSEFMWDEANQCLYQLEDDVKYVLVMKQMEASYNSGAETATEWRMLAVPMADAKDDGNYPVKLESHVHNLSLEYTADNGTYYRACGCGYKATVSGSVVPGEGIGVTFDLKLEKDETVTVTVAGEEVPVELTDLGYGAYSAFIPLAAAQMTDEVKISVGGDLLDEPFTVKASADAVLTDAQQNQYAKDLMSHMLAYGTAAQNYFGYNTDNLAGSEMPVTMPTDDIGVEVQSDLSGVTYYGASVRHEGRTVVRFYFNADSVEGLTFTVDGNAYEATEMDGKYFVEVTGINPLNLDQEMNIVVSDGQRHLNVQYSPLDYIIRTYRRADVSDQVKALVKAMYGYHAAAKTYIANKYLKNGFDLVSQTKTTLYEGVDQYYSRYMSADAGQVKAYAIVIDANANVELKVSAGAWSADSTADDPGETKTVFNHFIAMDKNEEVLAMINGGFFDYTTNKTMKPYGMQIVDGVVKQAPSTTNAGRTDNWFGMTKDGKYVISNTAGYESEYKDNVLQGVGGGRLLMIDGVVQNISSSRDYRTAVGVNDDGDLVLVVVDDATYSDVSQIFVDLGMNITTVLNLDGGGSTAMYVPGSFIPKALLLGSYREVADAVGIVVKN